MIVAPVFECEEMKGAEERGYWAEGLLWCRTACDSSFWASEGLAGAASWAWGSTGLG